MVDGIQLQVPIVIASGGEGQFEPWELHQGYLRASQSEVLEVVLGPPLLADWVNVLRLGVRVRVRVMVTVMVTVMVRVRVRVKVRVRVRIRVHVLRLGPRANVASGFDPGEG